MKRLTTILLLVLFSYNFLGAGFVYNIWLYTIKKEVKEQVSNKHEKELTLVKVPLDQNGNPPADFQWHEEDEFRYHGQMYDIIRSEDHGSQIWYYCHWDKAETRLLNNLSDYVSNYLEQHPEKQQQKKNFKTVLDQAFLLSHSGIFLIPGAKSGPVPPQKWSLSSLLADPDTPPPQYPMIG